MLARIAMILGIVLHLGMLTTLPVIAHPAAFDFLVFINAVLLIADFALLGLQQSYPETVRLTVTILQVLYTLAHALVVRVSVENPGVEEGIFVASAGLICISGCMIQAAPVRSRVVGALSLLYISAGTWSVMGSVAPLKWSVIYAFFITMSWAIHAYLEKTSDAAARREYRFRTYIAPNHFVQHAVGSDDFYKTFQPETRFCVCLSSDWRNYQQLTGSMSAKDLSQALNAYYNLCNESLASVLPSGNYYTDWIADELFIVIFDVEGSPQSQIVHAALDFSEILITKKRAFYEEYGVPKAIDIGLSAGEAYLGLMGPDGHPKATALGEVPGRSRRLQAAGKLLRHRLGDADRVIFDVPCLMQITAPYDVRPFKIADNSALRDIDDDEIYYLANTPAQPARTDLNDRAV